MKKDKIVEFEHIAELEHSTLPKKYPHRKSIRGRIDPLNYPSQVRPLEIYDRFYGKNGMNFQLHKTNFLNISLNRVRQ